MNKNNLLKKYKGRKKRVKFHCVVNPIDPSQYKGVYHIRIVYYYKNI